MKSALDVQPIYEAFFEDGADHDFFKFVQCTGFQEQTRTERFDQLLRYQITNYTRVVRRGELSCPGGAANTTVACSHVNGQIFGCTVVVDDGDYLVYASFAETEDVMAVISQVSIELLRQEYFQPTLEAMLNMRAFIDLIYRDHGTFFPGVLASLHNTGPGEVLLRTGGMRELTTVKLYSVAHSNYSCCFSSPSGCNGDDFAPFLALPRN